MGCATLYRRQDGFTLAEVLISIVIFSVVISMTYGAYNMTFKVINNANTNSKYGERARITLDRITEDLQSIHMGKSGLLTGETNNFGEHRGDNLTFTSRAHLVFTKEELPKGYATISYTVEEEEANSTLRLYRSDVPYLPGEAAEEEKGFLLCDGLREFAVIYMDEDDNETDAWSRGDGSFSDNGKLPKMVKIKIGFIDEDNQEETVYFSTAVAIPVF